MEENNLNSNNQMNTNNNMEQQIQPSKSNNKMLIVLMALIIVGLAGYIVYSKFIQKNDNHEPKPNDTQEKECNCPKCEECEKCKECEVCENSYTPCNCSVSSYLGAKINSVKKVTITKENQTFNIGNRTYKVKIDDYMDERDVLFINDDEARIDGGKRVNFDNAYLTDQFMFFTGIAQDNEMIVYAYGVDGEIKFNDNNYQMEKFVVKDNYLHASGREFCGVDDADCPMEDLIIKYIDNTLIVTKAK